MNDKLYWYERIMEQLQRCSEAQAAFKAEEGRYSAEIFKVLGTGS